MRKLDFLIADDHCSVRMGIRSILERESLSNHIFEAQDGRQALESVEDRHIDVAFIDFNMPILNGYEVTRLLVKRVKDIKILAFSVYDEIPLILNLFKAGARGYLSKTSDATEILNAIRSIMVGGYYYHSCHDSKISDALNNGLNTGLPNINISGRQLELIKLISLGMTNQEIASRLNLSLRTVQTYRYSLIRKVNVSNTAELVNYAFRNGIL